MRDSLFVFVKLFDMVSGCRQRLWVVALLTCVPTMAESGEAAAEEFDISQRAEWRATSTNGVFNVVLGPRTGRVSIGKFQVWELRLTDAEGEMVFPARFGIGGGMQGHGHGLPTQPRVTNFLPDGRYVIEGMKFNMAGDWTLYLAVEAEVGPQREMRSDQVQVDIVVDY